MEEKYFKQLHLVKIKKVTNLIYAKCRFDLIVKLIANKYYKNIFYFLFFLSMFFKL